MTAPQAVFSAVTAHELGLMHWELRKNTRSRRASDRQVRPMGVSPSVPEVTFSEVLYFRALRDVNHMIQVVTEGMAPEIQISYLALTRDKVAPWYIGLYLRELKAELTSKRSLRPSCIDRQVARHLGELNTENDSSAGKLFSRIQRDLYHMVEKITQAMTNEQQHEYLRYLLDEIMPEAIGVYLTKLEDGFKQRGSVIESHKNGEA